MPRLSRTHSSSERNSTSFSVKYFGFGKEGRMSISEEGQVIGVHSVQEWEEHFKKGAESKKLVVVDFTASWCGPCRFIAPILADIAKRTPHVIFLKVDVDELKEIAAKFEVDAMPTFLFFKEGEKIDTLVGARKEELQAKITGHGAACATA